jgi:hypothetical protein
MMFYSLEGFQLSSNLFLSQINIHDTTIPETNNTTKQYNKNSTQHNTMTQNNNR